MWQAFGVLVPKAIGKSLLSDSWHLNLMKTSGEAARVQPTFLERRILRNRVELKILL